MSNKEYGILRTTSGREYRFSEIEYDLSGNAIIKKLVDEQAHLIDRTASLQRSVSKLVKIEIKYKSIESIESLILE